MKLSCTLVRVSRKLLTNNLMMASTSSISYMELVKEVASKGPESQKNIAVRAAEKNYSYLQLILSARRISSLLSKLDLKTDKGIKENERRSGARVRIAAKPSAEFVVGILGTWLSGGCTVPLALKVFSGGCAVPLFQDKGIKIFSFLEIVNF